MYLNNHRKPQPQKPEQPKQSQSVNDRVAAIVAAVLAAVNPASPAPAAGNPPPRPSSPRLPEAWKKLQVVYRDRSLAGTGFAMRYSGMFRLASGAMTTEYRVIGREQIVAHIGISADGAPVVVHCVGGVRPGDFQISV